MTDMLEFIQILSQEDKQELLILAKNLSSDTPTTDLAAVIKTALETKNGFGLGEFHFNAQISKINDDVITQEFIKQSKILKRTPILLVEDNYDNQIIDFGNGMKTTLTQFINNFKEEKGKPTFNDYKNYLAKEMALLTCPDKNDKELLKRMEDSIRERLEMYRRVVVAGGKVVSLDSSKLLDETQIKRFDELLNNNSKNDEEWKEFGELQKINNENAIKYWSDTIGGTLADNKNAVMVYTGAGHINLHQIFGLTSITYEQDYKVAEENPSFLGKIHETTYCIDIEKCLLLEDAKNKTQTKPKIQR